ncbi:hypothetical protein [Mycolicibacterium fortuitum]|uniref:hypothetical protein n=1 Tax=Mycolicibacterium fortuitum TaxID=1766 RepID=UPI001CE1DD47|nr:hypothetical protein [Mycolicibacterium fortuitum]MCA4726652.1 hypothetical protein [Mycolicibacterium fortuitum]
MTEQLQLDMGEFLTQTVRLAGVAADVTASPTDVPHFVVTPTLGRGKHGRVVLTGKLALTHTLTGRHVAVSDSFERLNTLAQQLAEFDWDFTNPNRSRDMRGAAEIIRQWQLSDAYDGPAHLWGDDAEMKAAREREPATTLLAEQLQWWIAHSTATRESDLYDTNNAAWHAQLSASVQGYGLTYLLAVLRQIDPTVADIAARDLVAAFDAGDSLGESIWQWRNELAEGQPLTLRGIPAHDPLSWSTQNQPNDSSGDCDRLANDGAYPREVRLRNLAALDKPTLVDTADHMATVAFVLGEHLADIAEMVGLDRDAEDLAIPPNVKRVVDEHGQYAEALSAIRAYVDRGVEGWVHGQGLAPTLIEVYNAIRAIADRCGRA